MKTEITTPHSDHRSEHQHKPYQQPTIQLYAIAPSCFLANSLVGTQSNAFGGVEEAEENDEGR